MKTNDIWMGLLWATIILTLMAVVDAAEKTCTFRWQPVTTEADGVTPEQSLAGYRLHTGMQAGGPYTVAQDVPVLALVDPAAPRVSVPCDEGSYWVVTAYDQANNESAFGNEVQVGDTTPPGVVPGFVLEEVRETTEERITRTTRTVRRVE